ncbi:MAG: hypothetical protein IJG68_01570 [Bacilli bacterium]|nr:hypothetical protein [Bacilli bacterium]
MGGEFIHTKFKILFLWKLGKNVHERQKYYDNIFKKYADYFSYCFGNSFLSYRENIHLMEKLYLNFPIYYEQLENITWDQYLLLLAIEDRKERYFYFYLSLFFKSDYQDTLEFIDNHYYKRLFN